MQFYTFATYFIIGTILVLFSLLIFSGTTGKKREFEIDDAILGPEELKEHAIGIARNHFVKRSSRTANWLILRMNKNYAVILEAYKTLNADILHDFPVPPAAEWLLDNFYVIEEEVKDIRYNLPGKHLNLLPVLKSGYLKGYPRIFAIALEIVSH
ncbi:MAG TPA: hypothetical protein PK733_15845, partial [Clostridiales bacterium]|nr:hypothetical protein [Clostridiales bacterium]